MDYRNGIFLLRWPRASFRSEAVAAKASDSFLNEASTFSDTGSAPLPDTIFIIAITMNPKMTNKIR